jgi:hypothetical protein
VWDDATDARTFYAHGAPAVATVRALVNAIWGSADGIYLAVDRRGNVVHPP